MSGKELKRVKVLSRVKRGELKLTEAAELLEVSYRQAKRLKKRYRLGGSQALVHGNVGRSSNRADTERRERVLDLVRENYSGEPHERFGPTLASEHLEADHRIRVPRETLRRWMLSAGLWSRRRKRKAHRKRRQRKAHFSELIQIDGSHHRWLEGRGPKACLMNFVDDATGGALGSFSSEETTWAAADLLETWVRRYGVPKALYCDWKNVYKRKPTSREADFHRRLPKGLDLKWVFCLETERRVSNDLVVRFENRFLQLKPKRNQSLGAGGRVKVQQGRDGELRVRFEGRAVGFEEIDRPQPKGRPKPKQRVIWQPRKPAADHPWRRPLLSRKRKTAKS